MCDAITIFWRNHGTKFLGFAEAAFGLLEFIDAQTVQLVAQAFGPHWGPIVSRCLQIGMGFATAQRGWINQRARSV